MAKANAQSAIFELKKLKTGGSLEFFTKQIPK